MPIANITVNGASAQGQQLKSLVSQLYSVRAQARQLLEQMQQQTDLASDYTHVEAQFGLGAGAGTTVYSLLFSLANGANNASGLENAAIVAFCARLN